MLRGAKIAADTQAGLNAPLLGAAKVAAIPEEVNVSEDKDEQDDDKQKKSISNVMTTTVVSIFAAASCECSV
eukprot:scaffold30034_cov65-Cyclotella_meneghiniana.AAC.4